MVGKLAGAHMGTHRISFFQENVKHLNAKNFQHALCEVAGRKSAQMERKRLHFPIPQKLRRESGRLGARSGKFAVRLRGGLLLQAFGDVEFDLTVARLEVLNRRREMQAQPFCRVVGEDDPAG